VAHEPYRFGAVRGVMCPACSNSLGVALTAWMYQRMRDLQGERLRRARSRQRQRLEQDALARSKLRRQLELEALPVAVRRDGGQA
jgi:hypothetical protein